MKEKRIKILSALAAVAIGCAGATASVPAAAETLTLLGSVDTYEESLWQSYLPAPESVQGDNGWTVYEGTVEGTSVECSLLNDGVWWRTENGWSGAYYRGYFNCAGGIGTFARWTAPEDGTVSFKGRIGVNILGEGFTYKIYAESDGEALLIDTVSFTVADSVAYLSGIELEAKAGESYSFEMTPVGEAECRSETHIFADFEKETAVAGDTLLGSSENWDEEAYQVDAAAWYPVPDNQQGKNNWYAFYGSVSGTLKELTYNGGTYWIADNPNNWTGVWYGHVVKSCLGSSLVFAWEAPHAGTVAFCGRATATDSLSGVKRDFVFRTYKETSEGIVLYDEVTVRAGETVYLNGQVKDVGYRERFYFEFVSVDGSETDIWTDIRPEYTVTAAEATVAFGDDAHPISAYVGDVISLPVAEKEGHTFKGWKFGENIFVGQYMVIGDVVFSAEWEVNKYKITFENCDFSEKEFAYGETIVLEEPKREGYTFIGWKKDGAVYELGTMPAENITLTAEWEKEKHEDSSSVGEESGADSLESDTDTESLGKNVGGGCGSSAGVFTMALVGIIAGVHFFRRRK